MSTNQPLPELPELPEWMKNVPATPQYRKGCSVCGIGANGEAFGYVCIRTDCPVRVSCQ